MPNNEVGAVNRAFYAIGFVFGFFEALTKRLLSKI